MGSTQKDAISVDLWNQEFMHMHGATQSCSTCMPHTFAKTKIYTNSRYLDGAAQRSLVHRHEQNEERSRVCCSCNFLFKQDGLSSSQPALLTGFVLHSEEI